MGEPAVVDKHGRCLEVGDNCVVSVAAADLTWKVRSVAPVMDPGQPANLVEVQFYAQLTMHSEHERPNAKIQMTLSHEDEEERNKAYAAAGGPSKIIKPS